MNAHEWLIGPPSSQAQPTDAAVIRVDCHRGLRGPYTGLGSVLRVLVPRIHHHWPGLVQAHTIEILSTAPELDGLCDAQVETLTSLASPAERTRIYPANRTRRLAHGAVELLTSYAARAGTGPVELIFDRVDEADPTDQEFLSILVRRAPADQVRVVVRTRGEAVVSELATALEQYAQRTVSEPTPVESAPARSDAALLRAFIGADGTSADPAEVAAYQLATPQTRVRLHDARAAALTARDERSLWFGAIPYHLEHGSDPAGAGVKALYEATRHCGAMGYYHMAIELGSRGRDMVDPDTGMELFWLLSTRVSSAMVALGQTLQGEPTYHDLKSRYSLPELHMSTSYALAMLYTRFHPPELRDHHRARGYINNSIAIASLLPDPVERAFHSVFQQNGLALIETHLGRPEEALRLVDEGARRLDRELPADKHQLHRSVLLHNRGKTYLALGLLAEALADMDRVVSLDPNYPDYYFDRAEVRHRLGDIDGALADADAAIGMSPPFYELHYNRAVIRADAGDVAAAIADFAYVVELEPDQLDARINAISMLLDDGQADRAQPYIEEGLRLHPDEASLLYLRGQLATERGDIVAARRDFELALKADSTMVAALASRAALAYDQGEYTASVTDLRAAVDLDSDNPDLHGNLGMAYEAVGDWPAAIASYAAALSRAADEDAQVELSAGMVRCQNRIGAEPVAAYPDDLASAR